MTGRTRRAGHNRVGAQPFSVAARPSKPEKQRSQTTLGHQGHVTCPVCDSRVAQIKAPYSIPEFGYVRGTTLLLPNHTHKGEKFRAARGDALCMGSMLSLEDARLQERPRR
jgi:hypothetical protein